MNRVWVCKNYEVEGNDIRIADTAQKAFEICKEYIEQTVMLKAVRDELIEDWTADFNEYPEHFKGDTMVEAECFEVES